MTTEAGQGGTAPGAGEGANPTPWHAQDHSALVTGKGWKTPDDALKSYSELEKHIGLPPDRLIRLPEPGKLDDAGRSDIFKRIGYEPPSMPKAPEKWEDYGVAPREGTPPEYTSSILQAAHKAGVTKEQLASIVEANDSFLSAHQKSAKDAEDALVNDRLKAADAAIDERYKDKAGEMRELMTREAARLGYDPDGLKATEEALALAGDKSLVSFRNLLADVAEARRESPLHRGATQLSLDSSGAKARLAELSKNPDWVAKATERGTPEAVERLMLNAKAEGSTLDEATAKRLASGTLGQ